MLTASVRGALQVAVVCCVCLTTAFMASASEPSHGFAYFGELKYAADMQHFDYVNPDAPKGGLMRGGEVLSFNNLNPFADKGELALYADSLVLEPLMMQSDDEIASYYGRLAETIEVADNYDWVAYTLRKNARWHDGKPVTVDDVIWTFESLKSAGSPSWKSQHRDIERIEKTGPYSFKFYFAASAKKDPQIVLLTTGFAPAAQHYWRDKDLTATTLVPPLGNGPYRIGQISKGQKIGFERVKDYWAADLPVNRGFFNFDRIEILFFLDQSVMLQSLRAGVFDYYRDEIESSFATAYDFDGYHQGLFKKNTYQMGHTYGMHQAIILNQRRAPFQDIRIREALTLAYNFEWANRIYWHNALDRNNSYFARSSMQAHGLPSSAELEILAPFRDQVPERVFTSPLLLPESPSHSSNRENLLRADSLLRDAGWLIRGGQRVHARSGQVLTIEFIVDRGDQERMLVPFVDNLRRLGIRASLKKIESTLMTYRVRQYDYDALVRQIYTFNLPYPSRIRSHFTSTSAQQPNMQNFSGIENPVVDELVNQVTSAQSEEQLNAAGRALDRVLFWNFYVIPDGHPRGRHLVHWDRFGHPPLGGEFMKWTGWPQLWWFDASKSARVDAALGARRPNLATAHDESRAGDL